MSRSYFNLLEYTETSAYLLMAKLGRDALTIDWDLPAGTDSERMVNEYRTPSKTTGLPAQQKADVAAAFNRKGKSFEAEYFLPYLAHAPMELLNCAVKIEGDKCEIYTGTQLPTSDRAAAAKILNLKPENVKIHHRFSEEVLEEGALSIPIGLLKLFKLQKQVARQ